MLHHQILLWRSHFSSLAALFVGGKKTEIKKKNAKISKNQKKNAFLFVNNKYHHELLLFAGKRRSSCDDTENINNEY
jgi:hypothetical protein